MRSLGLIALAWTLVGCATYQSKVQQARQDLADKNYDKAISSLQPLAQKDGVDQLIYVFDLATAYQAAGQYKESNKYFQEADKLSDQKNYVSLTKQGASLLLSEEMTQYKGEDFERLFINLFSAMNYIMLGDRESALVEVRRMNEKLEYYRLEEKKPYEQNPGALYLSAVMWEADKNYDSAYIDYVRAYKRDPTIGPIKEDLVRVAKKAGRMDDYKKWQSEFQIKPKPEWNDKSLAEVILIFQQGWGPRKVERERIMTSTGFVSPGLPRLEPVDSSTKSARLEIYRGNGSDTSEKNLVAEAVTGQICSIRDIATKTLEDAYAPLIAKRIAAMATKAVVAHQVGKKNEGLGALMGFAMQLADRADLRQWSTLPDSIQIARVYLKQGRYTIKAQGLTVYDSESGEYMEPKDLMVKAGGRYFIGWRAYK